MTRYLFLAGMLLQSFCFLSASGRANFDKDYPIGMNTSTTIPVFTNSVGYNSLLARNLTSLQMVTKYSVYDSGPVCFLEVISKPIDNRVTYWTKPCPCTPQPAAPAGF